MEWETRGVKPHGREYTRSFEVLYPVAGLVQDVTFLGDAPWGVDTHWRPAGPWGSARSIGCEGEECQWCGKAEVYWYGYFGVWDHRAGRLAGLAVTSDRWQGLKAAVYPNPVLRGRRFCVYHVRGVNAGFRAWEASRKSPLKELPPEPNMLPTLRRIYPNIAHLLIEGPEYRRANGEEA